MGDIVCDAVHRCVAVRMGETCVGRAVGGTWSLSGEATHQPPGAPSSDSGSPTLRPPCVGDNRQPHRLTSGRSLVRRTVKAGKERVVLGLEASVVSEGSPRPRSGE